MKETRAHWEVMLPGRRMEGTQICDHQSPRRKTQKGPNAWAFSLSLVPFMLYTIRPIAALKLLKVGTQKTRPLWPVVSAIRETRYQGITWGIFAPRLARIMMDWLLRTEVRESFTYAMEYISIGCYEHGPVSDTDARLKLLQGKLTSQSNLE